MIRAGLELLTSAGLQVWFLYQACALFSVMLADIENDPCVIQCQAEEFEDSAFVSCLRCLGIVNLI